MDTRQSASTWHIESIVGWASVAYGAGFVTVMLHTARMGIPVLELIGPINVWIGAPLAVVIFFSRKLWLLVTNRTETLQKELAEVKEQTSKLVAAQDTEWFLGLFIVLAYLLSVFSLPLRTLRVVELLRQLFDWMVKKYHVTIQIPIFIRRMLPKTIYIFGALIVIYGFLRFLLYISFIPLATYLYVVEVYPLIPQSLGGGKPRVVKLIVDLEKIPLNAPELRSLFPHEVNTQTTKAITTLPVDLLYLTKETYYVQIADNPIVSMNVGLVQGVIWIPRKQ